MSNKEHEIFSDLKFLIDELECDRQNIEAYTFNGKKSKIYPIDMHTDSAFDLIKRFLKKHTDYDISWLKQELIIQGSTKNKSKYDIIMRRFFCDFIDYMMFHGVSKIQSINLLTEIMDEKSAPQGFFREVRDTYTEHTNEQKELRAKGFTMFLVENWDQPHWIKNICANLILYSRNTNITLENKEKAFHKAFEIYIELWEKCFIHLQESQTIELKLSRKDEFTEKILSLSNKKYTKSLDFLDELQNFSDDFNEIRKSFLWLLTDIEKYPYKNKYRDITKDLPPDPF